MVTTITSSAPNIAACMAMASDMLRLRAQHVWIDYDQEADVLYMGFRKPQGATKTVEVREELLVRNDGRTIVGMTVLNASTRPRMKASKRTAKTRSRRNGHGVSG